MSATPAPEAHHGFTNAVVRAFLESNLSVILIVLSLLVGAAALWVTPREEDPQIVVPLADVYVSFPGHSAEEVEHLVATPLEQMLYQIDGVEYVYSLSRADQAVITVRFYVGQDRERSLVKLSKKLDENVDRVPPGVTGWVVKPVEIDDVPVVTLTLASRGAEPFALRRVAEELTARLAEVPDVSRAYVVGGEPRLVTVDLDPDRMVAFGVSPLEVQRALAATNVTRTAGTFTRDDRQVTVEVGGAFARAGELAELVVGTTGDRPVFLKDVARIGDGPGEVSSYVRHGWGPARGFAAHAGAAGTVVGPATQAAGAPTPAVTIAVAKKKGSNAVAVAERVLHAAEGLRASVVPADMDLVVTRNYGQTANEKVNELVEGLAVAILIVVALLTVGLGWREALVVALAIPVVFGLTLGVNLLAGYSINRVTLFALILALGLLVDDPIVDVENIARHFALQGRATRLIVLEAVAEIRPPLISATLAVIASFLPLFFITGMMGPYMAPMALNVPVSMVMSMVVAFTITPWLTYHVLRRRYAAAGGGAPAAASHDPHDLSVARAGLLHRVAGAVLRPLLSRGGAAWTFLVVVAVLTVAAMGLAAFRRVPLKMLPFDNKNELLLVLDFAEGTTLERADAAARALEADLATAPEVTDFASYVGLSSPMDFNGLVRHYYLRQGGNVAEIRVGLVGKKSRSAQSHAVGLRERDRWTALAAAHGANLKIVELPPGPPVLSTIVAEVRGRPDHAYSDLLGAAAIVRSRLEREPGVVDVDDYVEAPAEKLTFTVDREKAALAGVRVDDVARTVSAALSGAAAGTVRQPGERQPLVISLRLPRAERSSTADLGRLQVKGGRGQLVPLSELGRWERGAVDQTIYHKNLQRVMYVVAESAGRPPADCVVDIVADRVTVPPGVDPLSLRSEQVAAANAYGFVDAPEPDARSGRAGPRRVEQRSFLAPGGGVPWAVADGFTVDFAGEGEWQITLDVFRDLGLAFAAALVMIYIILVAQTGSFVLPLVVMMAIPLTVLGVMPGFWLLNALGAVRVGGYSDAVFFTATGMIGMIALAGIVTRNSVILVDFIHLGLRRGRSLVDAIVDSCVIRLRPILLTAGAALLSAIPIALDPIFSGLAWALIFGLVASTLFTLVVIPVVYWLVYRHRPGHGVAMPAE